MSFRIALTTTLHAGQQPLRDNQDVTNVAQFRKYLYRDDDVMALKGTLRLPNMPGTVKAHRVKRIVSRLTSAKSHQNEDYANQLACPFDVAP
ncbi:hypothetical protein FOPE_05255 [Fonsecaea pedrosoi]|nr:hypothetical protein FOPE_05255 [Fonsecaea pedrosoi]